MYSTICDTNEKIFIKLKEINSKIDSLNTHNKDIRKKLLDQISLELKSYNHNKTCNMYNINKFINNIKICKILIDNQRKSCRMQNNIQKNKIHLDHELYLIEEEIKTMRDKRKLLNKQILEK